jgi:hypothetical protein
LDGKDDQRDKDTPEENPEWRVVSLLKKGETEWAIVTNGKLWRLYSAKTHSRATNYYEIDLEEALAEIGPQAGDPGESFRYFWLLFRRESFAPIELEREGKKRKTSFVNELLEGSEDYAKRLGARLKDRVFKKIFPQLPKGFVEFIHQREGRNVVPPQERLDRIYHGTLTFLYRLFFLLYAEARDLLPVKEARGYWEKSLTRMKNEVAENAGKIEDEVGNHLAKCCRKDSYELYERLLGLFQVIDRGDSSLNVPKYNGGLFIMQVSEGDDSAEAQNARFLLEHKIPDYYLAFGLDLMARDLDDKRLELVFIDYKSLGVRQLGSIYEGLLEFKLRIAPEKMAVVKGKKTEEVIPYHEAVAQKRKILTEGRGNDAKERTYQNGAVYLENDRRERKATGSYYTPDYIVKYIVQNTVGPVLDEKFEKLRPKLREAQKAYRDAVKRKAAFEKLRKRGSDPEKVANRYPPLVDELFDVKVLDPAMGSGHFLVEAVDFITDRMIDFLNGFPWNPVIALLGRTRETILEGMNEKGINIDPARLTDVNLLKRFVLKRCIYGVDLNPMSVELAKVSLWLHCFTLGAPLSFLDHHLKCGNSLVGATDVSEYILPTSPRYQDFVRARANLITVASLSDATAGEVEQSSRLYKEAEGWLASFKKALNVQIARYFTELPGPLAYRAQEWAYKEYSNETPLNSESRSSWESYRRAQSVAEGRRLFHWQLEFPGVFSAPGESAPRTVDEREAPGFDAIVGNPPYRRELDSKRLMDEIAVTDLGKKYRAPRMDLWYYFVHRALALLEPNGFLSLITNAYWTAGVGARKLICALRDSAHVEEMFLFKKLKVFENVSGQHMITLVTRGPSAKATRVKVVQPEYERTAEPFVMGEAPVEVYAKTPGEMFRNGKVDLEPPPGELLSKLSSFTALSELGKVRQGIAENPAAINRKTNEKYGGRWDVGQGVFVLRPDELRALNLPQAEKKLLRPYHDLCDVGRYFIALHPSRVLIYSTRNSCPNVDAYAKIRDHLSKFRVIMESRRETRTGSNSWWHLHWPREENLWLSPKVVSVQMAARPAFVPSHRPVYVPFSMNVFVPFATTSEHLNYIAALLNSRLIWKWYQHHAKRRGVGLEINGNVLTRTPIRLIDFSDPADQARHDRVVRLVEGMLSLHSQLRAAEDQHEKSVLLRQISATDTEIDQLAYELYGLTDEEIKIVEEATKWAYEAAVM